MSRLDASETLPPYSTVSKNHFGQPERAIAPMKQSECSGRYLIRRNEGRSTGSSLDWETGGRRAHWYLPTNGIAVVATETQTAANKGFSRKFALTYIMQLRANPSDFIPAEGAALFDRLDTRPIHLVPTSHYRGVQPVCRATNPVRVNHPVV